MNLVDRFAVNAEAAGFLVHRLYAHGVHVAGISNARYALADTGSVVLAASAEEARANSLLPGIHLTRVWEDTILAGLEELFEALGGELPSSLAVVSGPSRSADIEQQLTVGVHGPGEVHVVLLPPAQS